MSLSEDKTRVRIDYLNFFGSEARNTVRIEDIESVTPLKSEQNGKYAKVEIALNKRTKYIADISKGLISDELLSKVMARVNDGTNIDINFPENQEVSGHRPIHY